MSAKDSLDDERQFSRRQQPSRTKKPKSLLEEETIEVSEEEDYCTGDWTRLNLRIKSENLHKSTKQNEPTTVRKEKKQRIRKIVSSDQVQKITPQNQTLPANTMSHKKVSTHKCTLKWVIENFSLLSLPQEAIFQKPTLGKLDWCCLRFYPKGHPDSKCSKNKVCFFIKLSANTIPPLKYELTLFNSSGKKITDTRSGVHTCNNPGVLFGFCGIDEKNKLISYLDKDDTLIIICSLIVDDFLNGTETLHNLDKLRNNQDFCDVTLTIGNEEFHAHKSILAARSLYFRKMFEKSGVEQIEIDGVKVSIFQKILRYMYTGKVLNIKAKPTELFRAACKFELPILKAMCQMHFKKTSPLDSGFNSPNLADNATDSITQTNDSDSGRKRPRSPVESASASSDGEEILGLSSNITAKKPNYCNELSVSQDSPKMDSENDAKTLDDCNKTMHSKDNEQICSETPSQPTASEDLEKTTFSQPKYGCVTKLCNFEHRHKWKVQNFDVSGCKNEEALSSPPFKIAQYANIEFNLLLYPNGCEQKCQNNICIFLQCLPEDSLDVDYEIELLNSNESKTFDIKNASNSSSSYCVPKNEVMSFLKDDELIIDCLISINTSIVERSVCDDYHAQELKNQLDVPNDLYKYIEKKDSCDVKVRVGDQDFYAHKTLLAIRSSTFRKSFNSYKGNALDIAINQIKPLVFEEILHYIYTGKVLNIKNSVHDLFEATFRIDLPELRFRCESYLIKNLSLDNVFQNLILAEKFDADELKKKAKNFIVAFSEQLVSSPGFKSVRELSSKLYQEILCLVLSQTAM